MSPNKVHWSFNFLRENQRLQDLNTAQTSQADHSKRLSDLLRILDNEMKIAGKKNFGSFKLQGV